MHAINGDEENDELITSHQETAKPPVPEVEKPVYPVMPPVQMNGA